MLTKFIAVAAICFAAAGCVPDTFQHYAPSASGGVLLPTHGTCNDVGDNIIFRDPDNSDVTLSLHVGGLLQPGAMLRFAMIARKERYDVHHGLLDSSQAKSAEDAAVRALWIRPVDIRFPGPFTVLAQDGTRSIYAFEGRGENSLPGAVTDHDLYAELSFQRPPGDFFTVEMPVVTFNGTKLVIPPVRFTAETVRVMAGINC